MKPIVIGYDGSEGARHAIAFGGELLAGRDAIVVTAFEDSPPAVLGDTGSSLAVDADARNEVEERASEGVELARQAGFTATARPEFALRKPWQTIVAVADEHDAALIVVGSHGFGGLRPLVIGSVSHQLAHHAHHPVLAVLTPAISAARRVHNAAKTAA